MAGRDVRRRWSESLLLVLAIAAGSATLTLGMLLHNVSTQSYSQTQAATRGPDLVAQSASLQDNTTSPADLAALVALSHMKGVVASSGPYPLTTAVLQTRTVTGAANVEGRSQSPAAVDQPLVTAGTWVRPGGVVVERAFAEAAGLRVGQAITLNGQRFPVIGIAVTTAFSPYPNIGCLSGCGGKGGFDSADVGLVWATEATTRALATTNSPLTYFSFLNIADPAQARALANAQDNLSSLPGNGPLPTTPSLLSWQSIAFEDNNLIRGEQVVVLVGSTLLTILSIASVAVLVGGRMADQMRRVGLLKAIGGTPGLVASVLLAEYLFLALVGAAVGLLSGWLLAPLLTSTGSGLLGSASRPPFTASDFLVVAGVALGVALVAALVPALRAARTSTVRALADSARPPHRSAPLVKLSGRLPVPLLIGLRVMARRLRRTTLSVLSIFVTVSGVVAVLIVHGRLNPSFDSVNGLINPKTARADEVLLVVTIGLVVLAGVNAVFITRAIAQDARHASAVTRALGATPQQVTVGLSLAQMLPALVGAFLGIPGGYLLYDLARHGSNAVTMPSTGDLLAVIVGAVLLVAVLTAIPARWAARRPVASILQAELA
jgi:putative ABC transport system permease protein